MAARRWIRASRGAAALALGVILLACAGVTSPPPGAEGLPPLNPFDCDALCGRILTDCDLDEYTRSQMTCVMSCDVGAQWEGQDKPDDPFVQRILTQNRCVAEAERCADVQACLHP